MEALPLLLAAVRLFGVLSYIVAQRTTEIGIRIALGAQREQVVGQFPGVGLRPAIYGLVVGLAASALVTRLISAMFYQTRTLDPVVFAAVSGMLLLVAALACILPAWRASRIDPVPALRRESQLFAGLLPNAFSGRIPSVCVKSWLRLAL